MRQKNLHPSTVHKPHPKKLAGLVSFALLLIMISVLIVSNRRTYDIRGNASSTDSLEAETAVLTGNVAIKTDSLASGGKYIEYAATTTTPTVSTQPSTTAGKSYYIDCTNGNDSNTGTAAETAWKSLAKAEAIQALPGERILLKKNCVWNGSFTISQTGTASQNIYVGAYGTGELPVIQSNVHGTTIVKIKGSFVTVENIYSKAIAPGIESGCKNNPKGFIIGFGFEGGSHDNTLRYTKATGGWAGVDVKANSSKNRILNNEFIDNNMMDVLDTSNPDNDAGAFGVALHGNDNEVAYNKISGSDACSYDYDRDGSAIEVYNGSRNLIHHNIASNCDAFTELGKAQSASSTDNTYAYNVFTSSFPTSVFLVTRGAGNNFGPIYNTKVYNNTVYMTGKYDNTISRGSQGVVCSSCGTNILTLKNNIIWAEWKGAYANTQFNEGNNLFWNSAGNPFIQGFTLSNTSIKANPQFINPAGTDFHVNSSSPAVDKGSNESITAGFKTDLDNKTVPQGSGVNIGAYE